MAETVFVCLTGPVFLMAPLLLFLQPLRGALGRSIREQKAKTAENRAAGGVTFRFVSDRCAVSGRKGFASCVSGL